MKPISLTGIKPTGNPHIGNYFGMYKPAIALTEKYLGLYFVADLHALTTTPNRKDLQQLIYEVAAGWLALGLDAENSVFFRQSDIPEIPECAWILACLTSKGLMNRAHAYKAAVDKNLEAERDTDFGVNMGLYNYPVLMAADILLYDSDVVPVGLDQKQHIEIARDIAENFNRTYGKTLKLPEGIYNKDMQDVPGTDGRKMSKSYGNTIPIFADDKTLRKQVMRIVTDSRAPEEPKNPDGDNLFQIFRLFATPERTEEVRHHYLAGGLGYGTLKQELYETIRAYFADARQQFNDYMQDITVLDRILAQGAVKARDIAIPVLKRMRKAVGIDR
ncbi:MAG: tryptophan--tRNA ligase [Chloroflexi bacterium]|nr:tryptophan--tRNA ligase [Chloroflexota bacterium]HNZ15789.1 tryptophan--tRNA ligase [Anaerolineaceae bacterium]